jgi:hypothetical protein
LKKIRATSLFDTILFERNGAAKNIMALIYDKSLNPFWEKLTKTEVESLLSKVKVNSVSSEIFHFFLTSLLEEGARKQYAVRSVRALIESLRQAYEQFYHDLAHR